MRPRKSPRPAAPAWEVVHPHAAAIDVHSDNHVVCVGPGQVQTFGFGNVTTTIYRDDRQDVRPTPGAPIYSSGGRFFPPEIVERRR